MKKWLAMSFVLLVIACLAGLAGAAEKGYDDNPESSWSLTFNYGASTDSTIHPGFLFRTVTVVRINSDVIVQPLDKRPSKISANPFWSPLAANPRAGQDRNAWAPDTLTTTFPAFVGCCALMTDLRVKAMGTPGRVKLYFSGVVF